MAVKKRRREPTDECDIGPVEFSRAYGDVSAEPRKYPLGEPIPLSDEEGLNVELRDELYFGDWGRMLNDLRGRLKERPYIFKLVDRIEDDIRRINGLKRIELLSDGIIVKTTDGNGAVIYVLEGISNRASP